MRVVSDNDPLFLYLVRPRYYRLVQAVELHPRRGSVFGLFTLLGNKMGDTLKINALNI